MTLSREERIHHHELLDRMLSGRAVTWRCKPEHGRSFMRRVRLTSVATTADEVVWFFTLVRNGEGMTYRTGGDRLHLEDT